MPLAKLVGTQELRENAEVLSEKDLKEPLQPRPLSVSAVQEFYEEA